MSEVDDDSADDEYDGGRPVGLYVLVGVIIVLAGVSGMFAIGYIPPILKTGSQTTTTSTRPSVQFVTITSTSPPVTSTTSLPGKNSTAYSVVTAFLTSTSTATSTQTSTQTVTTPVPTTMTASTTVYTSTSTTITSLTTTTTTVAPPAPLTINVTMNPPANPSTLHAGEYFSFGITINSTLSFTNASIFAYQVAPNGTPNIVSFYPQLPESVQPVKGTSYYIVQGSVSQGAPSGNYEIDVQVNANSVQNGQTQVTGVTKQFLAHVVEPLTFVSYAFVNTTAQFNGTCNSISFDHPSVPTWGWQCNVAAAPEANGTITFKVSNAANVPICIQTSLGSGTMTGFVKMNPYPFCPNGGSGVYVPAGANSWVITFAIENGTTAGAQTISFTFTRNAS